ncbi:hypothetical protein Bcav_0258 [Beutenbergia cavernae DSM 12333]|uniref:Lipoprotein n=1 Tax=Beutenbergia cavernae (strain ATCC BAA-8 / DSM 12333 / CCUG 43141 / JCM 11478 / NBRC 16432 / NCIMB 13614 / HKI 0122) TaxID=471853 RepID=C5BVT3_BEUC1|nr:hypothetical protein [Beutenbergia cavernae]ACQ78523.1 hypothetical protein Bcav_0258 [Beutenbergia cavernae DSM 12333]
MRPPRTRGRSAAVLLAALAVVGLPACSLLAPEEPVGPVTVCSTDPAPTAGEPGDAEILLRAGFLVPGGPPRYVVYTDGSVFLVGAPELDGDAAGDAGGAHAVVAPVPAMAPVPQTDVSETAYAGALPECALDQLVEQGDDLAGMVERLGGDLGQPMITDSGSPWLEYRSSDGEVIVASAYALGHDDLDGVNREQRRARELMTALGDLVQVNATALEPTTVVRLEVHSFTSGSAPEIDWPIDTPLDEIIGESGCGAVSGQEAADLIEAESTGHTFTANGGYLSLNVLAPGEPACS